MKKIQNIWIVGLIIAISIGINACGFLDVDENGISIAGEKVEKVLLTQQENEVLQQILSRKNPLMSEFIKTFESISEEVILIGSQEELLEICPDSITPPTIDFQQHCLIYGLVATPTSTSLTREVELFLQENRDATFYAKLVANSIDGVLGLAFPYAVFAIPKDKIRDLDIQTQNVFF